MQVGLRIFRLLWGDSQDKETIVKTHYVVAPDIERAKSLLCEWVRKDKAAELIHDSSHSELVSLHNDARYSQCESEDAFVRQVLLDEKQRIDKEFPDTRFFFDERIVAWDIQPGVLSYTTILDQLTATDPSE